jgi:transcriptional regulator
MYVPSSFRETDTATLHAFMEQNSFALLVSQGSEGLFASHLPILLDRNIGPHGRLFGHMARANAQWRQAQGEVMVVFSGPHTYISPSLYEAGGTVPTWNYVAVHAYGAFEVVDDPESIRAILRRSVAFFEGSSPAPWVFDESAEHVEPLLKTIVGFEIKLTRIEGKWKLNQNRPVEQRQRVQRALALRPDDDARDIAALMKERS